MPSDTGSIDVSVRERLLALSTAHREALRAMIAVRLIGRDIIYILLSYIQ